MVNRSEFFHALFNSNLDPNSNNTKIIHAFLKDINSQR